MPSTSKDALGYPKRITHSGSIADLHNNGRLGQRRTINDAASAYKDLIFKEHRWAGRYRRDNEERKFTAQNWNENVANSHYERDNHQQRHQHQSSPLQMQVIRVDVLGQATSVIPSSAPIARAERRAELGKLMPLPPTSNTAIAFPSSILSRNSNIKHLDFQQIPRNAALLPTHRNLAAVLRAASAQQNASWPCRSTAPPPVMPSSLEKNKKNNGNDNNNDLLDSDSDYDEEDVATASHVLASGAIRNQVKQRLSVLERAAHSNRKDRVVLERAVDDLEAMVLQLKRDREQDEERHETQREREREESARIAHRRSSWDSIPPSPSGSSALSYLPPRAVCDNNNNNRVPRRPMSAKR